MRRRIWDPDELQRAASGPELVYRKQLRPVLPEGTAVMGKLFRLPAAPQAVTG